MSAIKSYGYDTKLPENYTSHYRFTTEDSQNLLDQGEVAKKVSLYYVDAKPWFVYNETDGLYYRYEFGDKQIDGSTFSPGHSLCNRILMGTGERRKDKISGIRRTLMDMHSRQTLIRLTDAWHICKVQFRYIGRPLTAGIDISDEFPEVEQEWKTQVADISARPEYGILNKQIAMAEQQVKLNRSELLPRVGKVREVMTISMDWKSMTKL